MGIILAILLFSFIVFFHELGHFLLAKKNGIDVDEFAIGMGPAIYSKEYKAELVRLRKALYEDLKHRRDPLIWQDAAKRQLIDNKKL